MDDAYVSWLEHSVAQLAVHNTVWTNGSTALMCHQDDIPHTIFQNNSLDVYACQMQINIQPYK